MKKYLFNLLICFLITIPTHAYANTDPIIPYISDLKNLSEKEDADALLILSLWYEKNTEEAEKNNIDFNWFKHLADQGNPNAQTVLSTFYFKGLGTPINLDQSIHYIQQALSNPKTNQNKIKGLQLILENLQEYKRLQKKE